MRPTIVIGALLLSGCWSSPQFKCSSDDQCMVPGQSGVCVDKGPASNGVCALADGTCSSGLRYDVTAGDKAGGCFVPEGDDLGTGTDLTVSDDIAAPADLAGQTDFANAVCPPTCSIGDFAKVSGVSLSRTFQTGEVLGNNVYAIEGEDVVDNPLGTVAKLTDTNGTLTTFGNVGMVEANGRFRHTSTLVGSTLYTIGGTYNGNSSSSVGITMLDANGNPGTWTAGGGLAEARYGHEGTRSGIWYYVFGGYDDNTGKMVYLKTIERWNTSDATAAFQSFATTLQKARTFGGAFATSQYIYVVGGYNTTDGIMNDVERVTVDANGGISGSFSAVSGVTLKNPRDQFALVRAGDSIFIIGGAIGGGQVTGSVEMATLDANGNLSDFTELLSVTLKQPRSGPSAVVVGKDVIVFGGYGGPALGTDASAVEKATLLP